MRDYMKAPGAPMSLESERLAKTKVKRTGDCILKIGQGSVLVILSRLGS